MARRCRSIWRAGVLRPPGKKAIPDGTRCRLGEGHARDDGPAGGHDFESPEPPPETSEVEQAAAELLQFLPTGRYPGVPINNLRRALGAAWTRPDGTKVRATRRPPDGWGVPPWAWDDEPRPPGSPPWSSRE